jgi:hypothetical protein
MVMMTESGYDDEEVPAQKPKPGAKKDTVAKDGDNFLNEGVKD